jgi:predicted Rossmann fold nucleotide-binding protein DprA/Smf involved in DNA uptake
LRDGAKIVESADDIVRELGWCRVPDGAHGNEVTRCRIAVSGDPLIQQMVPGQPYDVDELTGLSGLEPKRLLPRLLDLELRGFVRRAGGGRFLRSF